MKSWGQLNQYLSSFKAQAGLQLLSLLDPRPFVGLPIHEGSFCALGASQGQHIMDKNIQLIVGLNSLSKASSGWP